MSRSQLRFSTQSVEEYLANLDSLSSELKDTQTLGVAAHSVRAVDIDTIRELHEESRRRGLVFHMHLEEQQKEIEDCQAHKGKTPMRLILDTLAVDSNFTAVHCTHTREGDMKEFVGRGGNVCMCPLTEGNLGDGIARVQDFEGRVCLGSDCNARICFAEEMRWLEYVQVAAGPV